MLSFASENIGDWDIKKLYAFIVNVIDQQVSPDIQARLQALIETGAVPIGVMVPFAGDQVPQGWLLCDGSAVSRFDYADLFSVIGTTFGAGDGSTTFNVPDMRGRVPVGRDPGQVEFNMVGTAGGEKSVTLTVSQIPAHSHQLLGNYALSSGMARDSIAQPLEGGWATEIIQPNPTTSSTGGGQAHNNLQPYRVINYIIKT